MVILTWPQANATRHLTRLQFVDGGSEKEPLSSRKKQKKEDCSFSKVKLSATIATVEQQHHYQQQQQQQGARLIMEQNSRTTTTTTKPLKRSLLPRKPRRDKKENTDIKLSNEKFRDGAKEYNLEDVCGFAATAAIENEQQYEERCKSKRFRLFEDKVEEGDEGHLSKVMNKRGGNSSLCPPLFACWPINDNNNNYTLSTTHLFLSILIFFLHLGISSCFQQPFLSENKVPLLHQQNIFQHGQNSNNHNMILPKSFSHQTTSNQKPGEQFKYHLNHFRPPSLVPITIRQVANGEYGSPDASLVSGSNNGALQASEPVPVVALPVESRWMLNAKGTQTTYTDQRISPSQYKQNDSPSDLPNNNTKQDSSQISGNDMRLVQLQLPLQLHLKLKPLPLPMPPPKGRSSINQLMNAAEKRRRSIEAANVTSNSIPIPSPSSTTTTISTTTDSTQAKNRADRDRRELMALTWREAKRILLLSSMSPTLVQKKLERRTADFPETAELSTRSAVGDLASVWVPKVGATSTAALASTTTAPTSASSGMFTTKQQMELEQSTTTPNPGWKPVSPQQPPTAEPLLPPATTSYNKLNLPQTTTTTPAAAASTTVATSTAQTNLSSLSPPLQQTVAQTTLLPQTTTTTSTFITTTPGKDEVRRQRHSSQLQSQGQPTTQFIDPTTDSRIQALAASMLPFFWPSFQLASQSQNIQPQRSSRMAPTNSGILANWPGMSTDLIGQTFAPQITSTTVATSPADAWPLQYLSASTSRAQNKMSSPMAASNFVPTIVSLDHDSNNHSGLNELDSVNNSEPDESTTPPLGMTATSTTAMPKQRQTTMVIRKKNRRPNYLTQSSSAPYLDSTRLASRYPMPKIKFQLRDQTTPIPTTTKSDRLASIDIDKDQKSVLNQQQKSANQLINEGHLSSFKPQLAEGKLQHIQVPKSLSKLIENQLLTNATYLLAHHKNRTKHIKSQMTPTTSFSKVVRLKNDTDLQIMLQAATSGYQVQDLKWKDAGQVPDAKRATANVLSPTSVKVTNAQPKVAPQIVSTTTTISPSDSSSAKPNSPSPITTTTLPERIITVTTQTASVAPATSTGPTMLPTSTTQTPQHVTQSEYERKQHATGKRQVKSYTQSAPTTTLPSLIQDEQATGGANKQDNQFETHVKPQQLDEMIGSNKVLSEEEDYHSQQATSSITPSKPVGLAPRKYGSQQGEANGGYPGKEGHSMQRYSANGKSNNNNNADNSGKNIKLFHFKRKPDMAKLPFYKKPLNYTELGWTPEQIQEHLEQSALLLGSIQGDNRNNQAAFLSTTATVTNGNISASNGGSEEAKAELLLLKRKRRGKSQFERLMAELHGAAINNNTTGQSVPPSSARMPLVTEPGDDSLYGASDTPTQAETASPSKPQVDKYETTVPVMKKKVEALVLKPVFFVMNQKRRPPLTNLVPSNSPNSFRASNLDNLENVPPPVTTPSPSFPNLSEPGKSTEQQQQNRSKPIIRLRRKHHGEQPMSHFRHPSELWPNQQVPWRPSRPFWSMAHSHNSMNDKLMLVPSGLLTPSGSHLVPLYDPHQRLQPGSELSADEQSRLVNDLFAWRPSRDQSASEAGGWQVDKHSPISAHQVKPNGGLAPSGEESFLVAPSAPLVSQTSDQADRLVLLASSMEKQHAQQQQQQQQQQPSQMSGGQQATFQNQNHKEPSETGLRVPRLLVKPMRPAKYSLNGYIPKPSLTVTGVQAQLAQPSQQNTPFQSFSQAAMTMNKPGLSTRLPKLRPSSSPSSSSNGAAQQNKDLDSSTSNEIFSRRRGLQQHQRSSQAKSQLTFNSLLGNPSSTQTTNQTNIIVAGQRLPFPAANSTTNSYMSPIQRQMEENKRKYIVQQQQLLATPTLSVQKANLIKAKLGLTVTTKSNNSWQQQSFNQKTAASSNNILTADPTSSSESTDKNNFNSIVSGSQNGQLIGAPLNSIPKTDFECTDKKGKFISGLFADFKTGCQVWHLCSNNRKYSFLCPSGTIFNAKLRICDWRYNVKCENALQL